MDNNNVVDELVSIKCNSNVTHCDMPSGALGSVMYHYFSLHF